MTKKRIIIDLDQDKVYNVHCKNYNVSMDSNKRSEPKSLINKYTASSFGIIWEATKTSSIRCPKDVDDKYFLVLKIDKEQMEILSERTDYSFIAVKRAISTAVEHNLITRLRNTIYAVNPRIVLPELSEYKKALFNYNALRHSVYGDIQKQEELCEN